MLNEKSLEQLWQEHQSKLAKERWKGRTLLRSKFQKLRLPEKMFNLFKKHLNSCESDNSKLVVSNQLNTEHIRELITKNTIAAIHIPRFCPREVAESLSKRALEEYTHWKLGGVVSTDMFYAGGSVPIEVAGHSWPDFRRYFGEREEFVSKQRVMSNGTWPVDRLRLELDETWPYGACLGHYLGQKLRPAIMRIMDAENNFNFAVPEYGFIHTDDFPSLNPKRGTFSANIYLKMPEEGGDLYIWSINLNRIKGIFKFLNALIITKILTQNYLFDIRWQEEIFKLLPKPHILKPQVGDLVIFHSGRPHSVAPVTKGIRVTNQLFIYVKGSKVPLTIGS